MSANWWKEAVIYQIYPSSFKDSDDDGWGDLKGILSKVDYLKELGVDIVWISPIYKSPQADMGYDISDYRLIDPIYGTNEDIDILITELQKRDMKLMMDLVVNHTSNEHAWFLESKSSKTSVKRDWYIWKDPKGFDTNGNPQPPNNWCQLLGDANSAWTYDSTTEQFYLSLFTPEQPDLNWETPAVRAAVHDVMRFWLEKGVCGYRMDVINLISKDQRFLDAEETMTSGENGKKAKYHPGGKWYTNRPRLQEYLQEIKREVLAPYDAVSVGEMPGVSDVDKILAIVHQESGPLKMIFIFDIVDIDNVPGQGRMAMKEWKVNDLVEAIAKWQKAMFKGNGWNSVFIENHDNPRSVSRYCNDSDQWREKGAKLLALMQTTLGGTLFVYQGEELGMRNVPQSWDVSEYKDVEAINFWTKSLELHDGDDEALQKAREVLDRKARDHARTPMQWDASLHAGFCSNDVKPWMRVNDDYPSVNAQVQIEANLEGDLSVFQYWQRGLANRKTHADVFVHGEFELLDNGETQNVFSYTRAGRGGEKWMIVLHFGEEDIGWDIPGSVIIEGWMAGNYIKGKPNKATKGKVILNPWEGLLAKCVSVPIDNP